MQNLQNPCETLFSYDSMWRRTVVICDEAHNLYPGVPRPGAKANTWHATKLKKLRAALLDATQGADEAIAENRARRGSGDDLGNKQRDDEASAPRYGSVRIEIAKVEMICDA